MWFQNYTQFDTHNPGCIRHWTFWETFFVCFFFLGPHLLHMEVPRLGVEWELQLSATATATATQDPSHICDLYHRSQWLWILNPPSEARDQTRNLMVPSQIRFHCATTNPPGSRKNLSYAILVAWFPSNKFSLSTSQNKLLAKCILRQANELARSHRLSNMTQLNFSWHLPKIMTFTHKD